MYKYQIDLAISKYQASKVTGPNVAIAASAAIFSVPSKNFSL